MTELLVWLLAFAASLLALGWAFRFYKTMMEADEGSDVMRTIAESVRRGADAYLYQQYRWVTIAFLGVAILLAIASYGFDLLSGFIPIAFLTGGFFSGLCGWFGMKTATQASRGPRTFARSGVQDLTRATNERATYERTVGAGVRVVGRLTVFTIRLRRPTSAYTYRRFRQFQPVKRGVLRHRP